MRHKKKILTLLVLAICLIYSFSRYEGTENTGNTESAQNIGNTENAQNTGNNESTEKRADTDMEAGVEAPDPAELEEMTVHFLDVGQGLSVLVQSEGKALVYDGGPRSASAFLVSYLQKQGITEIEYLIASHYDEDHIAGLVGCLHAFSVNHVIGPDYVQDTKIYQSFIDGAEAQGVTVESPTVGTEISFGAGKFTILAPDQIYADSNGNSIVIKLENGENSFLLTGDATAESEKAMCHSGLNLDSEVLCISHHGSASATSWEFLQAVLPETAVISCGRNNQYGHPDKDTMDKLEAMEIAVYRTDLQGTVVAVSDGNKIQWNTESCNDYRPGNELDEGTQPAGIEK